MSHNEKINPADPGSMVCDECGESIPLDEHGVNYDHHCLDPRSVRVAYDILISGAKLKLGLKLR